MNVPREAFGNWGLITFEPTLMADQHHMIPVDSYRVSFSVVRELARSWFGGLVTVERWDDKWLNEGFVRWISRVLLAKIRLNYDHQMIYFLSTMMETLDMDTLKSRTHLIKQSPLQTFKKIETSSGTIIYEKAECLINMLVNCLGAPKFQQGIRKYVSSSRYDIAGTKKLCLAVDQMSPINVARLVCSWLDKKNHPVVVVQLSDKTKKPYRLSMRQERFPSLDLRTQIWAIPITILISGRKELTTLKFVLGELEDFIAATLVEAGPRCEVRDPLEAVP